MAEKSNATSTVKPVRKSTARPAAKAAAKPAAKTAAKATAKSPAKAAAKPAAKPSARTATKAAPKTAAKSSAKPAKRTSGMQIPKNYPGAASKIAELSRNPLFIEIAAASLVAAAGAMMGTKRGRSAAGKVGAGAREAAVDTADLAGRIGQAVATALSQATHLLHPGQDDKASAAPSPKGRAATSSKRRAVPIDTKDGAMPYVS
jgi:hypothetical protein